MEQSPSTLIVLFSEVIKEALVPPTRSKEDSFLLLCMAIHDFQRNKKQGEIFFTFLSLRVCVYALFPKNYYRPEYGRTTRRT